MYVLGIGSVGYDTYILYVRIRAACSFCVYRVRSIGRRIAPRPGVSGVAMATSPARRAILSRAGDHEVQLPIDRGDVWAGERR